MNHPPWCKLFEDAFNVENKVNAGLGLVCASRSCCANHISVLHGNDMAVARQFDLDTIHHVGMRDEYGTEISFHGLASSL